MRHFTRISENLDLSMCSGMIF